MKHRDKENKPSLRKRVFLSLGSLAVILLVSGIITIFEYRRMTGYVSELVTANIENIDLPQKFSNLMSKYNEHMVSTLNEGADSLEVIVEPIDMRPYLDQVDSLMMSFDTFDETSLVFDELFYRSVMPGVVSVGAGILLIFLLIYFTMSNYVNPICSISDGIDQYRQTGHRYSGSFDGDDQLANINSGIVELMEENVELKKRIKALKDER